jgi:phage protein U
MASDVLRGGPDGDLDWSAGFADDDVEPRVVAQQIQDAISLVRGEYFLDVTAGADWISAWTTKGEAARQAFLSQLEDEIRGVRGVASVQDVSMDFNVNDRTTRISFSVRFVRGRADASAAFVRSDPVGIESSVAWTWRFR